MSMIAKMSLENVFAQQWGGAKAIFRCVYDPNGGGENASFTKATPSGFAEFQIDNPAASSQLVIGQEYYFDVYTAAESAARAEAFAVAVRAEAQSLLQQYIAAQDATGGASAMPGATGPIGTCGGRGLDGVESPSSVTTDDDISTATGATGQ